MKKIFSVLSILILFPLISPAQKINSGVITGSGDHNNRYLDMFQDLKKNINTAIPISELEGSPYLKEEFVQGQIFEAGNSLGSFYIRYNIYNEVMEILTENDKVMELRKSPSLNVYLNNRRFRVLPYLNPDNKVEQVYFEILEDGNRVNFLRKHYRNFHPGQRAKTSFHVEKKPELEASTSYYFHFNNENLPVEIKKLNERNIINSLNINKKEIVGLIEKNDLNLKRIEDVNKLIALLNQRDLTNKKG
ncbi:hypothetical protein [Christiangramia crocea]|uniref:Uncharacterized protein n=1 Tax=Christiangramia crocea TaxID=2904124 RepID=A0A9X2A7U6_9FLAO|nr:hypothetical protein [Gramella crocea]MCG9971897.1 hypothetical protein [Gramella crocea]